MAGERAQSDFGRRLQAARETRGISLHEIALATKISVSALAALERNDISRLPGGIFSRAFVRAYAAQVGLDPEATLQEFLAQFPSDAVAAGHLPSRPVEDNEALESRRQSALTFIRLFACSVPLAALVLYLGAGQSPRPGDVQSAAGAVGLAPGPTARAGDVGSAVPALQTAPTVGTGTPAPVTEGSTAAVATAGPAARAAQVARLTVVMAASRPCRVSATLDGKKDFEGTLQVGEQHSFDVHDELVLTAADAAAVSLRLNGAPARSLGGDGQAVTMHLTGANFRTFLAEP
jgi:cytoskeleton protein RodZ